MKTLILVLVGTLSLLGITGCATLPSQKTVDSLDYGQPLTVDYQEIIKKQFDRVAKDPVATLYDFSAPEQYWYQDSPLLGGKIYAGYGVPVRVNAKNSLGGDTGYRSYIFIFHNNVLIKVLTPEDVRKLKS